MAVIIETRELSFRYSEDSPLALEDVTLSIEEGSFTAVLGHNGSGKSTFAKHLDAILLPSGGQKQRVAIAGILAMQPRCIVMDEPTAMLDPSGRAEVMAAIQRLNRSMGVTVVLITHHMDEAAAAQRVIVMKQGRVALDGTPRQIFSQVERMRELSLSVPQTVELLYTLDRDGAVLSLEALSVEECADEILKYLEA